ncbi:Lactonase, 7-bladed beta-propeller-domain-containing protein [Flammula alnicola]|nr:Lactonase, 7-bladed beta-propeller-domain-containing protein [Flammula alnicola]
MVAFKILAGGYDVFVATYLFNSDTSSLTLLGKSPTGSNPSWITLNPQNRSLLYAVNENPGGALQSFIITPNASLSNPLDTVSSEGSSPAFAAALSTGSVAVMNYDTGNGRIIPTTSQESEFVTSAPLITFPPPSGGVSHPHMALEHEDEVLVPDLGGDTIWRLKKNTTSGAYFIQGSLPQPKGSGPRHIAIFNDRLFTVHELASTLSVQTIPPQPNGTSITFATVSIIPPNPPAGALWAGAEVLIPAPTAKFPVPYIYVSNPTGDSIAIFEHALVLVKQVFTGLDQIRGMEFGNEAQGGDEFLIAGGVAGTAGVIVLRRTEVAETWKYR